MAEPYPGYVCADMSYTYAYTPKKRGGKEGGRAEGRKKETRKAGKEEVCLAPSLEFQRHGAGSGPG